MLNKKPNQFRELENWGDFLSRWNSDITVPEAIGLLYAGVTIPDIDVANAVDFYIELARLDDSSLARTAAHLVVTKWLDSCGDTVEALLDVNKMLVGFLAEQRWPALLAPPHPLKIHRYLGEILLLGRISRLPGSSEVHSLLPSVVKGCLCWGVGEKLLQVNYNHASMEVVLKTVKAYLNEHKLDAGDLKGFLDRTLGQKKIPSFSDLRDPIMADRQSKYVDEVAVAIYCALRFKLQEGMDIANRLI